MPSRISFLQYLPLTICNFIIFCIFCFCCTFLSCVIWSFGHKSLQHLPGIAAPVVKVGEVKNKRKVREMTGEDVTHRHQRNVKKFRYDDDDESALKGKGEQTMNNCGDANKAVRDVSVVTYTADSHDNDAENTTGRDIEAVDIEVTIEHMTNKDSLVKPDDVKLKTVADMTADTYDEIKLGAAESTKVLNTVADVIADTYDEEGNDHLEKPGSRDIGKHNGVVVRVLEEMTTKHIPKQKPKSGKFWKEGKQLKRDKRKKLSFDQRMKKKVQNMKNKELSDLLLKRKAIMEEELREKRIKAKMKRKRKLNK